MPPSKGRGKAATSSSRGKPKKRTTRKAPKPAKLDPAGSVIPYLAVADANAAIDWYRIAFGAREVMRQDAPGGKIMHAELRIGTGTFYLSDIFPGSDLADPARSAPSVNLHVYSRNVEKMWNSAIANGAKATMPIDDMFWGDRYGRLIDPFGHSWALSYKSKLSKRALEEKRKQAMADFGKM